MEEFKQDIAGSNKVLEVLWTPEQVAKYFMVSRRTVYQWISKKKVINPIKIMRIGNSVRIPRSEIERVANQVRKGIKLD